MIPQTLEINKRPILLPCTNFGKILGCPDWVRTHAVAQQIHIIVYVHKTDRKVMMDVLSSNTQPMKITGNIWPIYPIEQQLLPYCGMGFQTHASDALDEYLARPFQPSYWNGSPIGMYDTPVRIPLMDQPDLGILPQTFANTQSPRALDQIIRVITYHLRVNQAWSYNPPDNPYNGEVANVVSLVKNLIEGMQVAALSSETNYLLKYFKDILDLHCTNLMTIIGTKLAWTNDLEIVMTIASGYSNKAQDVLKKFGTNK